MVRDKWAVGAEVFAFTVFDLAAEEAGKGVVDAVFAAFAVQLAELVVTVPIFVEYAHEGVET